jgi:RNA polymerase sigma-70 factor (sigma-E family)
VSAVAYDGEGLLMSDGGTADLAGLYAGHYRRLVQLAALLTGSSAVAEDLVQDAFVRVMARPGGRIPDLPLAYLRSTVLNLVRSRWRRAKVGAEKIALVTARPADVAAEPDGPFERLALVEALRGLPRRQREVVVLRYFLDLPVQEVAETLGIGTGTVKSYSARALEALRSSLEDPLASR